MHECDTDLDHIRHLSSDYKQNGWNLTRVYFSADALIFVYENKTLGRDMMLNSARELIVWFGSGLSAWTIVINLFLIVTLLVGLLKETQGTREAAKKLSRWLILNFTVVQLLIGGFVIPLNVATDRHGGWIFGGTMCRVWLMTKLLLVAETMWSMFVVTFDRFLQTVSSLSYLRWCGWKTTLAEILLSWAISALVLIPTLMAQNDGDFILEEVCATSMSPEHTLFVTLAVFVVPATLIIIICGAIGLARMRSREHEPVPRFETEIFVKAAGKLSPADLKVNHDYCHLTNPYWSTSSDSTSNQDLPIADGSNLHRGELTAIIAVSVSCVMQWGPFHAISAVIPFCEGFLCVNPTLWSLLIWLGYSTAGLAPVCWFLDPWIRRYARSITFRRRGNGDDVISNDVTIGGVKKSGTNRESATSNSSLLKNGYPSLQSSSNY